MKAKGFRQRQPEALAAFPHGSLKPAMATLAAQQKQGAALLSAMKPVELPENVMQSSFIVEAEKPRRDGKEKPVVVYNQ